MKNYVTTNLILDDQGGQQISVRTDGKSPTLRAEMHGNQPCVLTFEPGIASRVGGHVYENISGTLRATPGDNQMTVAFTTEMAPKVDTKGKAFSLRERDYKDPQAVVLENHPNDSRVKIDDSGTVQTLTGRCGTGGGNVPMVLEPVCFQQNQREEVRIMDVLGAITAESGMHNTNYVVFSKIRRAKTADDFETWKQSVCTNTLNTFDQGDVRATDIVVCLPVEHHPQDSRAKISFDGINQPLTSNMEHDPGNGGLVICLQGNGIDRADTAGCNGKGWTEDVSYTLNTIDRHAVAFGVTTKGNGDAFISEERHTALTNGGGQAGQGYPCVIEVVHPEQTGTLMANSHPGSYTGQDAYNDMLVVETFHCNTEEEKTPPIKARDYKDPLVICYEKTKK